MISMYGDIEFDKCEKNVLELGLYYAIYEYIDKDKIKAGFLTTLTKIRWDGMRLESSEIKR